jgi:WD40 repeat protein
VRTFSGVRVSADGRFVAQLVLTSVDPALNVLTVYEVATGRVVLGPLTPPFNPADLALNADGSLLALTATNSGDLAVYRVLDGQLVGSLSGLSGPEGSSNEWLSRTAALVFDHDGRVYLGSKAGPIRLIDPSTMQVIATLEAPLLSSNNQLILTEAGLLIAAGDEAATAIDTSTGSTRWTISREPGSNACTSIAVAESAGRLYCRNSFSS